MEHLIKKDIFNTTDLMKHGPDYSPNHFINRMNVRSLLVKDTHNHGKKMVTKNINRKSMKRLKDNKVNSEIVKLRDGFHNMNLKNQVMLKEHIKKVKPIASNSLFDKSVSDHQPLPLNSDIDTYLSNVIEEKLDLIIYNDTDFKLYNKQNENEFKSNNIDDQSENENKNNDSVEVTEKICVKSGDETLEEIFKIDFKVNMPKFNEENEINSRSIDSPTTFDKKMPNIFTAENETVISIKKLNRKEDLPFAATGVTIDKPVNEDSNCDNIETSISQDITVFNDLKETALQFSTETYTSLKVPDDFLSIIPIRTWCDERQINIMKKYIRKWKDFVKRKKNGFNQQRQLTLDRFFDKLVKKKKSVCQPPTPSNTAKLSVRDFNKYQHRYKIQKHIIALQRAKLEQQNRVIEELKYNKIVEASKKSVDTMKEEVLKTYFEVDRQLRPKMKCLTNELKLPEIEEPNLVLHCLKVPQFLQRMEKRAREREEKHAMIRERRKQMEEERVRLKQQAELAKIEMDKEEKVRRMKELREKRKREKIENIRKQQHAERMRALIVMADLHYEKTLMTKYGIRPLRLLMEIKRDNIEKAKEHYRFQLKKNIFLRWMFYTEDMWFERNYKAEDFHRKKVLMKYFGILKENRHEYVLKKQVAEDYYDLYVTQLAFRKFREGFLEIKKEQELKWQKAIVYNNSNLLFKTFTCWRTLPALNALKREQEARKARWREKVLLVVPDYSPPDD